MMEDAGTFLFLTPPANSGEIPSQYSTLSPKAAMGQEVNKHRDVESESARDSNGNSDTTIAAASDVV